jgi:hypothetical protein
VYMIVSGVLLLACFVGLIIGTGYKGLELSAFPFIDSLKLERVIASAGGGAVDNIREVFRDVDLADNKQVLERTASVTAAVTWLLHDWFYH